MFSSKIIISSRIVVIFWLLDYFSLWEIRRLVLFCPCYWHTLRLGRLWSKSFIGLQLVVIRLMYPAGGESYQKFAVVLLTVLSFWQIWADLLNTFFESREKCAHLISASLNRPFPSSPGSLFQKKGKCSAFDMEIIFHSHAKLIFTRKVVHLASFWKWGFLELGNGLFYYIDASVLLESIPLVKFIKTTFGTRVVYFP